ncbi:MAG TPA: LamG-like jellyroll fold domain-containing protein [Phycisphaerae bacterium]|nr:LamG-like jellyroll fold domain-containing protein [Phycisphaerae bacterium]
MSGKSIRGFYTALCIFATVSAGSAEGATPAFQQAIADSQPIIHYQLNETTGPAINHGSLGAAFDATYFGTPRRGATTFTGDAGVAFDGVEDYLESLSPAPAVLTGNPTFTIETLVVSQCNGIATGYPPFLQWGSASIGGGVFFSFRNDSNSVFVGFYDGGLRTVAQTPVGEWMHLVWVRQGGGNSATGSTLYLNGQQIALTQDLNLLTPNVSATAFRINRAQDGSRFFVGEMDELAVYDRALPESEIVAHYEQLLPRSAGRGDSNCDGHFNGLDIDAFLIASLDPQGYEQQFPLCDIADGDFTGDSTVDIADVPMFVQRLLGDLPTPFQQAVLSDQPQLYYQFNASRVAANKGLLGPAFNAFSPVPVQPAANTPAGDGGVFFSGPDQYFEAGAPVPPMFTGNPTFSAEAVVFPTCTALNYPPILHWGSGGTAGEVFFSFHLNRADRVYLGLYNAGLRTVDSLPAGQWVHLVWARQSGGDSQTGTTLYVNGQAVALTVDTVLCCNPQTPNLGSAAFRINGGRDFTRYFVGQLDEVALYDYILTPEQVVEHYEALGIN